MRPIFAVGCFSLFFMFCRTKVPLEARRPTFLGAFHSFSCPVEPKFHLKPEGLLFWVLFTLFHVLYNQSSTWSQKAYFSGCFSLFFMSCRTKVSLEARRPNFLGVFHSFSCPVEPKFHLKPEGLLFWVLFTLFHVL